MPLFESPRFELVDSGGNRLTLRTAEGHVAHAFVLEEDIIRVMVLPHGKLNMPRTWAIAPGAEDIETGGRDRFDLTGFALPQFASDRADGRLTVSTKQLRLSVKLDGLYCAWENLIEGEWRPVAADRPTQAYNLGWWDHRVYHYLQRDRDDKYFGLGERAGNADRHGNSYRMINVDAMGYNPRTSDPLYKHIPFYISWNTKRRAPVGFFYDTLADCTFDMGRELDNYHGLYRYFVAESGDLDYYVIGGETIAHISKRYTWLTGRPNFSPKWGLGCTGSTMTYPDAPNAQERMNQFLADCEKYDIIYDSFHMGSGYTSIGNKRYLFHWNRSKFPDPKGFTKHFMSHGVRLCANIKPCLLQDHPRFSEAAEKGLLVHKPDHTPAPVQFWDEMGSYLDFTNPATLTWWKEGIKKYLLEYGIASAWNDNNEYEIWDTEAAIHGFGQSRQAVEAKPLQALQMMRASCEAQREFSPNERPFVVSRSGTTGMQRYVQTWSGDNFTSWETLKYNIRMGTGLALSGVSNTGHDVGGFSGPAPSPELLLRWVQFGIFMPRFAINSWNDDGTVNEPWMYPEIRSHVSRLLKLRYRLMPYFYDLLWRSHSRYEPMIRPTFYDFQADPRSFEENDEMMLGGSLLVAAVVEQGARERKVYLPVGTGWFDFWSGDYYEGGQEITLAAPWAYPPLVVKAGAIIPLNVAEQHFNSRAEERGFALFPPTRGSFSDEFFEDDGLSEDFRKGRYGLWAVTMQCDPATIAIDIKATGAEPPKDRQVTLLLPLPEQRKVTVKSGKIVSDWVIEANREVIAEL
ncbi:MAG TPA: glycoside hydrolase family 31 protein [Chthoniobacterales bacterium]|nr:glycoside hydrolase family 31 protein [Chthoniobacterales bacterium]